VKDARWKPCFNTRKTIFICRPLCEDSGTSFSWLWFGQSCQPQSSKEINKEYSFQHVIPYWQNLRILQSKCSCRWVIHMVPKWFSWGSWCQHRSRSNWWSSKLKWLSCTKTNRQTHG
jgi:hypothetical protein